MAVGKLKKLVNNQAGLGSERAIGESMAKRVMGVTSAVAEPIGSALKFMGKCSVSILQGIGRVDVAIGDALGFADIQQRLRVSMETNQRLNPIAMELLAIDIRRVEKRYDLGIEDYLGFYSAENFSGSDARVMNYSKMSMEGLGDIIGKIIDKIKNFFSKIWNSIKEGFQKSKDLIGFLEQKIDGFRDLASEINGKPNKEEFPIDKKISKGIPYSKDYNMNTIKDQYEVQLKAVDLGEKFTRKVSSDMTTFEKSFRSDAEAAMAKLVDNLKNFTKFDFGTPKVPLAGNIYYDVTLKDLDEKSVQLRVDRKDGEVIIGKNAVCETLNKSEIETLLDRLSTLLLTAPNAYNTYQSIMDDIKKTNDSVADGFKQMKDKEMVNKLKTYITLYNGIYSICPALMYFVVLSNVTYIESSLKYVEESLKCY